MMFSVSITLIPIGSYRFIDKEFISRYDALKEVKMSFVATTISEHIRNEGMIEGKRQGKIEGMTEGLIKGKLEGQIQIIENLYVSGVLSQEQYGIMVQPLRKQLEEIQSDSTKSKHLPVQAAKGRRKPKAVEPAKP
jgi:flagellar biosynthesis/type III secretory pathway protein FliH